MPTTVEELLADLNQGVTTIRVSEDGNSFTVRWIPDGEGLVRQEVIEDIHEEFERLAGSETSFWECVLQQVNAGQSMGRAMLICLHRNL